MEPCDIFHIKKSGIGALGSGRGAVEGDIIKSPEGCGYERAKAKKKGKEWEMDGRMKQETESKRTTRESSSN
jgi:hypothetical protein